MFMAEHSMSQLSQEVNVMEEIWKEGYRLQEEWKKEKIDLEQQVKRCGDTESFLEYKFRFISLNHILHDKYFNLPLFIYVCSIVFGFIVD